MTVQTKEAAAEAAGEWSDIGSIFAGAATVAGTVAGAAAMSGVGAPIVPGALVAAGLFGALSAAGWHLSGDYGDLANDPPRHDYHLVTKFSSRNVRLPPTESQRQGIWNEFSRTQIDLADAIAALITSFERLDGARLDLRKPGADPDLLARRISTQRQAITYNAKAATQRIRILLRLQNQVNSAWRVDTEAFRTNTATISDEQRQQAAAVQWNNLSPQLLNIFRSGERLNNMRQLFEDAVRTNLDLPNEVLDSRWRTVMLKMEKRLAVFAGEVITQRV